MVDNSYGSVSSFKNEDYYTILGFSQKQIAFIGIVLIVNAGIMSIFNPIGIFNLMVDNPILFLIEFIPSIFALSIVKVKPVSDFLYNFFNSRFHLTPSLSTNYLTYELTNVNDYLINGINRKIVVVKLNSDDFYNKTQNERVGIFVDFNAFLTSFDETLIFRVINKSLNLSTYFEIIRDNVDNESLIHQFYYEAFVKSYEELSRSISDYDYYLEIHFKPDSSDQQIETRLNLLLRDIANKLNVSTYPQILRGNEIYNYIKNVITGSEYSNVYDVPLITDF